MKKIKVIAEFRPDGTVSTEVEGMKGSGCLKETEAFEKAIGAKITKRTEKPEMRMTETVGATAKQKA